MSREMVNSGIPWIGEIPKGWCVNLLSSLFDEHKQKNKGLVETNLLSLSYGKIIRKDINTKEGLLPESFDGYNVISSGDIVFRLTDLQNDKRSLRTGLCTENGIITSAYVTIRGRHSLNSAYYHYLFHSYDLCKVFYGMGEGVRQGMNYGDLRKLLILLPSLSEQQKIASFLDRKCSEIDEMITLQERIVDELKAYKQSVITEAVTKGLNPDVPMKDSGIEWIGEIPEHWDVCRLKNVFRLKTGTTPDGYDVIGEGDKIAWFTPSDISDEGNVLYDSERTLLKSAVGEVELFPIGSIMFVGIGASAGKLGYTYIEGYSNQQITALIPNGVNGKYFYYFLIADKRRLKDNAFFTTLPIINNGYLSQNKMLCPPSCVQNEITDYLDTKCTEIDNLISIKLSKIDSLKEYKKSIIYEYVTGKKEVI